MSAEVVLAIVAAVTSFFGGLAAIAKWTVGQWKDAQADTRKSTDAGTAALIANTASNAVLVVKLDHVVASNAELSRKIDGIGAFIDEVTPVSVPIPSRRTPPRGVALGEYSHVPKRGGTHGGG